MSAEIVRPLFGVVGSPIGHSKSPLLHRAAYAALGFDAEYDVTEVGSGGLGGYLSSSPAHRRGVSVTMPLKTEAWLASSTRDRAAELTGAVNTLVGSVSDGLHTPRGANTDVGGIVGAVRGAGRPEARDVLVVGAGATAASAVVAASDLGARRLTIAARSAERAAGVAGLARSLGLETTVVGLEGAATVSADLVVSTLPGGADVPEPALASFGEGALLLDVAYSPWPSAFVTAGLQGGAVVVHGLSMLVHQAARQVRLFAAVEDATWKDVGEHVTVAMFDAVGMPASGIVTALD
ncbi:shikimate dehydrogenase family protein [Labedella endophytica]|uniref:Shikimate dehydrogenase n=1 Tax=Labedella endophytica TaxID=1523160 RepID=A0A433JRW8_9MICO|nr:shikimate dehydrogenase [Labedella endophytica]RUR00725.1 shikimate dehydrogenase [Labedella endophytica]